MGCGATRRIQFAQVVPDQDGQEHEGAVEAGRRGQRTDQRRGSTCGRAFRDVPANSQTVVPVNSETAEIKVCRQGGEMPKEAEDRETSKQKQPEGELGLIFSAEVSEPKSLITWRSHDFKPCALELAAGHPLPPCATSQDSHLRRLQRKLARIVWTPSSFQADVMERRDRFDQKVQKLDGEER
eukprot:TRINITY_DN9445_c0_g1_i2.p1 TRINITY_DN9445_c0_g1~~TRINITY_DN9445_c0_g1_i2.p1  ORF type:complete len:183 (-),score=30.63 TRINITY_DN9445_c0_g1_i2:58-606(-)